MGSKLFFSLNNIKPQKSYPGGSITYATANETPGLVDISFSQLKLNKNAFQEPIWHPNANKIGYCQQGTALVSIRGPSNLDTFTVKEGDVFFVPKGHVHYISNIGSNENIINFAYNNSKPELMNLSSAFFSLSDSVFTGTFDMPKEFIVDLKKNKKNDLIRTITSTNKQPPTISSRFKFNIADSNKPILTKGGYLQLATKPNLPILDGLGILGFGLNKGGIVEPHWHTNAGELVYIVKGRTRITVLSPDGNVESLEVNGGEGAFAPASHFHNIENIGNEDVEVIAFFSHAEPDYIGLAEVMGSFSNEVLASIFNVAPKYFDSFKKTEQPLVIVPL